MPACSKSTCANQSVAGQRYCEPCIDTEVKRIKNLAKGAINRIKGWRKAYNDTGYNCGSNWRGGKNYECVGGIKNPIRGHRAAIAKLVAEGYLDGSDKGEFKKRHLADGKNILVHVEGTDTL
jgi:hypothetical protein